LVVRHLRVGGARHQEAAQGGRSGQVDGVGLLVELWCEYAGTLYMYGNNGSRVGCGKCGGYTRTNGFDTQYSIAVSVKKYVGCRVCGEEALGWRRSVDKQTAGSCWV
jgi:hypothetical protein